MPAGTSALYRRRLHLCSKQYRKHEHGERSPSYSQHRSTLGGYDGDNWEGKYAFRLSSLLSDSIGTQGLGTKQTETPRAVH